MAYSLTNEKQSTFYKPAQTLPSQESQVSHSFCGSEPLYKCTYPWGVVHFFKITVNYMLTFPINGALLRQRIYSRFPI